MEDVMLSGEPIFVELNIEDYYKIVDCFSKTSGHRRKVRDRWREVHEARNYSQKNYHTVVMHVLTPQVSPEIIPVDIGLKVTNREISIGALDKIQQYEPLSLVI